MCNYISSKSHYYNSYFLVYIFNKDNERLKLSLLIDSELKDTKEISSDSELKINSYLLNCGLHLFKITWWDEDVKRSYEIEESRDIQNDTSVNFYTYLMGCAVGY